MLSIIIPTLNEEKYLPRLLESIKKQSFKDYEIIVADAGSKDATVKIAERYNCKVVPGGLVAKGRNEGAKNAIGDVLLFLDADMFLTPNFLERALREFEKRKLGVAGFPIFPIDGKKIDKIAYDFYNKWARMTEKILPHSASTILAKKEIHKAIGGFDEKIKFVEDHPYSRAAKKITKYGFIKKEPVFTSMRRVEKDGRFKTYTKYVLAEGHLVFLGPIKSNIFNYKFNHYDIKRKDKHFM